MRVLILGGTGEARHLADVLHSRGLRVTSSLAGRTEAPVLPAGEARIGGFGPNGLADYLRTETFDVLIDATHPFASAISATAVDAAAATGCHLIVLRRPGWTEVAGDRWTRVPDVGAAVAEAIRQPSGTVFLTTGQSELAAFAADGGHDYLVRVATAPAWSLPTRWTLLVARGPFELADELALLRNNGVSLLVTKDSGGERTYAKLAAARRLQLPVVMIDRPPAVPGGSVTGSVDGVLALLPAG